MKKTVKILALVMSLLMVLGLFVACGGKKLSGTYTGEIDVFVASYKVSYVFRGSKVMVCTTADSLLTNAKTDEYECKYEITEAADGTMSIEITYEGEEDIDVFIGKKTLEIDEEAGTIKLDGITFTKKDK